MNWFIQIITNPYLVIAVSSWGLAQVAKTIIYWVVNKKLDIWRLFGDGGMPSGHSATVASLAATCAYFHGFGSFEFAVGAILAIIVCHDASGGRLETGKQTLVIKEIADLIEKIADQKISDEVKLKEFVGHTSLQVAVGATLGIINSVLLCNLVF